MKQIKILLIILAMSITQMDSISAQIPVENKNPNDFLNTKIYPLRDAENGVKVQKVSYPNRLQIIIVANLFLPPDFDKTKKYPAIVVGHPFGGVKEQTSGLHAQKLAELGYVTLAYDAAFYGESGGYPRYIEVPEMKIEDFSAAIDFLSNHILVDKNRIGVLGICGSGGYSVAAA